ncbi:hypothetical protein B0H17DRAFT_1152302 [Mycena rosella]|uniref:Uncharacterized protein n=1 Tax=Mycena rosella TaxID=1033263 RepID=A0AAD7BEJ5_MYCRO|nr:hypothetical protein B0H17DRAFT_1152302 [Mycena rosella]
MSGWVIHHKGHKKGLNFASKAFENDDTSNDDSSIVLSLIPVLSSDVKCNLSELFRNPFFIVSMYQILEFFLRCASNKISTAKWFSPLLAAEQARLLYMISRPSQFFFSSLRGLSEGSELAPSQSKGGIQQTQEFRRQRASSRDQNLPAFGNMIRGFGPVKPGQGAGRFRAVKQNGSATPGFIREFVEHVALEEHSTS